MQIARTTCWFAGVCVFIAVFVTCAWGRERVAPVSAEPIWGRLANPGSENARIKATLFFPGQARDGTRPYECFAGPNLGLYTVHPQDERHLNWSKHPQNRTWTIDRMVDAGVNVVAMSSWGEDFLPCSVGWSWWAPMQSSTQSHDEVFAAAVGRPIFVMPFIESRPDWAFRSEFPQWGDQVAPGTVGQIVNLLDRYVSTNTRSSGSGQWARVYDREGQARYAVAIIHAASDQLNASDHVRFAQGFGAVEQEVFNRTGHRVGFFLDMLPPATNAPGRFRPSAQGTGAQLQKEPSILGVMCFIPEVWVGSSNDQAVINWKRQFSQGWAQTGIPFIMDVSPGYDAHVVFPSSVRYGLNIEWTVALTQMVRDYGQDGLIFNSWNGYTEAMAAVPVKEYGETFFHWLTTLTCIYSSGTCQDALRCTGASLPGDVNRDCVVNLADLALLAEHWLSDM